MVSDRSWPGRRPHACLGLPPPIRGRFKPNIAQRVIAVKNIVTRCRVLYTLLYQWLYVVLSCQSLFTVIMILNGIPGG